MADGCYWERKKGSHEHTLILASNLRHSNCLGTTWVRGWHSFLCSSFLYYPSQGSSPSTALGRAQHMGVNQQVHGVLTALPMLVRARERRSTPDSHYRHTGWVGEMARGAPASSCNCTDLLCWCSHPAGTQDSNRLCPPESCLSLGATLSLPTRSRPSQWQGNVLQTSFRLTDSLARQYQHAVPEVNRCHSLVNNRHTQSLPGKKNKELSKKSRSARGEKVQ